MIENIIRDFHTEIYRRIFVFKITLHI